METKCYYKIENNIDFVWRIREIKDDPYRKGESIAEHFVGNTKQFVRWIVKNEKDLKERNLLEGYQEIGNNAVYDEVLGLLRKDEKFPVIYGFRQILGLEKIARIEFENTIEIRSVRDLFQKAINIDKVIGDKIINIGFEYYKKLWETDEYFSEPNLNTIEKFKPTIELQSVNFYDDIKSGNVTYYFRPSWDEEHGLHIKFNLNSLTGEVDN
ncbi:MAG: hypothetical protein MK105_16325 [Crocinitomicaceae bacterium]|nr:hypothetical protein [Crocinitomicaceae bacterium]